MPRRLWLLPIVFVIACNPMAPATVEQKRPPVGEVLYLQEGENIRVRDAATGAIRGEVPNGLISPDWKTVYVVYNGTRYSVDTPEGRTTVHAMDVFGETVRSTDLPGEYQLATAVPGRHTGLSADGRTLVLAQPQGRSPTASRFAVLDTSFESPPRYVDLPGHFTFDALNPDGKSLFLIEHISDDGYAYRVRRYGLGTNTLDPNPIVLKGANPHEAMQGSPAAQVASAKGDWVYTLYSNYRQGPFIHALQTNGNGIACITLGSDWRTENGDEANLAWSMALSPDGGTLYVANAALGVAASIDAARHFGVIRRTKIPQPNAGLFSAPVADAKPHVRGGAAMSPDGQSLYLIGRKGVAVLNTRDLSTKSTFLADRSFVSIVVSPDGKRLYAVESGGSLIRIDTATGATAGDLTPRPWSPLAILHVAAAP